MPHCDYGQLGRPGRSTARPCGGAASLARCGRTRARAAQAEHRDRHCGCGQRAGGRRGGRGAARLDAHDQHRQLRLVDRQEQRRQFRKQLELVEFPQLFEFSELVELLQLVEFLELVKQLRQPAGAGQSACAVERRRPGHLRRYEPLVASL